MDTNSPHRNFPSQWRNRRYVATSICLRRKQNIVREYVLARWLHLPRLVNISRGNNSDLCRQSSNITVHRPHTSRNLESKTNHSVVRCQRRHRHNVSTGVQLQPNQIAHRLQPLTHRLHLPRLGNNSRSNNSDLCR